MDEVQFSCSQTVNHQFHGQNSDRNFKETVQRIQGQRDLVRFQWIEPGKQTPIGSMAWKIQHNSPMIKVQ